MKNKIILAIVIVVVVVGGILLFKGSSDDPSHGNSTTGGVVPGDENLLTEENNEVLSDSICKAFSKEYVATNTGLNIVSTEVKSGEGAKDSVCYYYIEGKKYAPVLTIGKYENNVSTEKQKYADEKYYPGWRVLTDSRISMEHFITYNEVQQLNDIYLIKGKNEYYRITLYSLQMLRGSQMIELALQIASKIN
jgi:hypothetical protein